MKRSPYLLILIITITLLVIFSITQAAQAPESTIVSPIGDNITPPTATATRSEPSQQLEPISEIADENITPTTKPTLVPPTPTPNPFSALYGCEMELQFQSGPLESKNALFSVLGRDYFYDKSDKFAVGKGTSIFYEAQRYFIVHSSYVNGNVLKPMEAEFIRKYLESWGNMNTAYIQGQIDALVGSEVTWICDGEIVFNTRINDVVRLSHVASERLWLEPEQLEDILSDREGLVSEWVGDFEEMNEPKLYIGFCGWGPNTLESGRYTYFRYLVRFEILN